MTNTSVNTESLAAVIAREAIQVAEELDQIRSVYGEDCLTSVKRALHSNSGSDLQGVIEDAVLAWEAEHPRPTLDFIL